VSLQAEYIAGSAKLSKLLTPTLSGFRVTVTLATQGDIVYPLFQARWDRCNQQSQTVLNYLVKVYHLYSGT
jgi:hypothetical protein